METREGFGTHGNVALFDDFPTVTTVEETLAARGGPSRELIGAVLDELAFCMKTATRLGRVVRIGDRWWGHPQAYGSSQMEVADEYARTGVSADEFDLWAVLDTSDLIALVAFRSGIVMALVDTVVSEFCNQVESFHVRGIHFRTPARELGVPHAILDELAANLDVLAVHDHQVVSAGPEPMLDDGGPPSLLCREGDGGLLVIELHAGPEGDRTTSSISNILDIISSRSSSAARGLVLSDGYSQGFVEQIMSDDRVMHRNLRSLDLPLCRAQRWAIYDLRDGETTGWIAVAADGRTVVNGGGPAFPSVAFFEPFDHLPIDWENQRLLPHRVGDRFSID